VRAMYGLVATGIGTMAGTFGEKEDGTDQEPVMYGTRAAGRRADGDTGGTGDTGKQLLMLGLGDFGDLAVTNQQQLNVK